MSTAALIRRFYAARAAGDLALVRALLDPAVDWVEPEIAGQPHRLRGAEAVLDMLQRARVATGGTFRLDVTAAIETATHCAAVVAWSAMRDGRMIRGRELAVFELRGGRIVAARFHPEDIAQDNAFWGVA
jgi:ketosteroid isomerase-like protein